MASKRGSWWQVAKTAVSDWSEDGAPRLGAALAYYAIFSLAPLLVLVSAIAGLVFGADAVDAAITTQLQNMLGPEGGEAVQEMVAAARHPRHGVFGIVVGGVALAFGAIGVFGQLQDSLNLIWEVPTKTGRGILGMIKDRLVSFAMVLGTAFLLLVSLAASAALAAAGSWAGGLLPWSEQALHALEFTVSFAVVTLLFALLFKLVPDVKVAWRDVWLGAIVTAALFTLGKFALGLYLGQSNINTSYGSAGSLMIVLLWIYYSSQILFFGAEFTQAYARLRGSRFEYVADESPRATAPSISSRHAARPT